MTRFDFSPLFRATVGFDRLARLLEDSMQWTESSNGYPPYNIEKLGDNRYRITIAVAGFGEDDLNLHMHENTLIVEGLRKDGDPGRGYLYRGIAGRAFKRHFQLADHVEVAEAHLENGLLVIDLKREVPEAMQPRRIPILRGESATIETAEAKSVTDAKAA